MLKGLEWVVKGGLVGLVLGGCLQGDFYVAEAERNCVGIYMGDLTD